MVTTPVKRAIVTFILIIAALSIQAQTAADNDSTFNPTDIGYGQKDGINNVIIVNTVQSDGKIIIGGRFTTFNQITVPYLTRLNADGSLDKTFNAGKGPNGPIEAIVVQPDGKIIIGGDFWSYDGIQRSCIARLNSDGSLDSTFNIGKGPGGLIAKEPQPPIVNAIGLQNDGKIVIAGFFLSYNNIPINDIARLNSDGSLDTTFDYGAGGGTASNNYISDLAIQTDQKIIIGGNFNNYNGIVSKQKLVKQ